MSAASAACARIMAKVDGAIICVPCRTGYLNIVVEGFLRELLGQLRGSFHDRQRRCSQTGRPCPQSPGLMLMISVYRSCAQCSAQTHRVDRPCTGDQLSGAGVQYFVAFLPASEGVRRTPTRTAQAGVAGQYQQSIKKEVVSSNVKIPVLDLMPRRPDQSQHTMLNTIDAARAAESYGYERFWVAEHHNAGSCCPRQPSWSWRRLLPQPSVFAWVRAALCSQPRTLRGGGAVRVPSTHSTPVAIDLGVGRTPGTDPMTAAALRRDALGLGLPPSAATAALPRSLPCTAYAIPSQGRRCPVHSGFFLFGAQLPHSWVCPTRSLHILRPQCCRRQ